MKAIPAPSPSGSKKTSHSTRGASAVLMTTLLAMSFDASAQEPIAAVWKAREIDFLYRSNLVVYSCSALQGRVASILRAVGARDDVEVSVSDCQQAAGPPIEPFNTPGHSWETSSDRLRNRQVRREQLAHVRVRLMSPVEVTPEVLAEMERDKGRRELVSRVTGDPRAMFDDPVVFTAQRQPVTLSRSSIGLEPQECELLEQVAENIFHKLDVDVISRDFHCSRNRISRIPPQITVEALIGTPVGVSPILQAPGTSEGEDSSGAPATSDAELSEPSEN